MLAAYMSGLICVAFVEPATGSTAVSGYAFPLCHSLIRGACATAGPDSFANLKKMAQQFQTNAGAAGMGMDGDDVPEVRCGRHPAAAPQQHRLLPAAFLQLSPLLRSAKRSSQEMSNPLIGLRVARVLRWTPSTAKPLCRLGNSGNRARRWSVVQRGSSAGGGPRSSRGKHCVDN